MPSIFIINFVRLYTEYFEKNTIKCQSLEKSIKKWSKVSVGSRNKQFYNQDEAGKCSLLFADLYVGTVVTHMSTLPRKDMEPRKGGAWTLRFQGRRETQDGTEGARSRSGRTTFAG